MDEVITTVYNAWEHGLSQRALWLSISVPFHLQHLLNLKVLSFLNYKMEIITKPAFVERNKEELESSEHI